MCGLISSVSAHMEEGCRRKRRLCCGPASSARGAGPGGQVRGAGQVRARPDRGRARRQAGPRHRPRRRDPALHPDPVAAHQEQPGAHRRARRRQDGRRRGCAPSCWRCLKGGLGDLIAHRHSGRGRAVMVCEGARLDNPASSTMQTGQAEQRAAHADACGAPGRQAWRSAWCQATCRRRCRTAR